MNFFEHIAATDDSERIARRKASVIAAQRFDHQFGAFLKGANSKEDFKARLALIDSEIKEMTYDVAEEYGGDPQVIESAVRRHFLGAAHTVEERDGKYFVVEDGGAETVAGPFDERQEAQDRASELDELEPLEKKEAAMDNEQWRRAIEGLLSDIESMYGETPSDAEYLTGSSADEDLLSGLRDFVQYGYQGPNPAQTIKGIFSDINSMWGGGGSITEYVKDVLQNEWSDDTFADMHEDGEAHYGSTKVAVRRPKMCPYHSELTEASLQAGEPQYAAFSALVGGNSHCKGSFEGKCNFKPEMVTQEFWNNKAQQAAERKQLREQQQQEAVEIAEEPILEEPVAENTELTDELSEAPSAVGEMSLEGEGADMGEDAMAMTAAQDRPMRHYQPGNPVKPGDMPVSEEYPSPRPLVDTAPGGAPPQLHPEEISGAGIPLDEDPYYMLTPEEVERIKMMREKAASEEDYYKDRSNPPVNRSNTTPKGAELNRYRSRGVSDIPVKPGDYTEGLTGEEITGAGIPIDQNIYHQLTEEDVRRINLMREKAAKFASLRQAKDCDCWEGYKRVPGTKPCAPGSCEKCDSSSKKSAWKDVTAPNSQQKQKIKEAVESWGGGASDADCMGIADDICYEMDPEGDGEGLADLWDNIYQMAKDYNAYVEHQNREVPHNPFEASRRQASERNANFAEFVNEAARMFPDAGASIQTNNNGEIILIVDDHLAGEGATDQILELAQSYGLQAGDPDRFGYGPNAIFSGDIFPELAWQTGLLSDMPQSIFDAEDEGYEREASRRQAYGPYGSENERYNWEPGNPEPFSPGEPGDDPYTIAGEIVDAGGSSQEALKAVEAAGYSSRTAQLVVEEVYRYNRNQIPRHQGSRRQANDEYGSSFGDSFIGTKLTINGQNWEVVGSEPGDSGAEEDCFLHLQNENGETAQIHYEDYDEGDVLGQYPNDPLAGNRIEYPDGEPESVRVRRQEQAEDGIYEKDSSRRQAEVAWDGGGANKNERGNWAWGHQEPKADESGLDDAPSGPAMDKTRWQPAALDPNGNGNLKPVDSEYPGSPNPTIQQVLWERREDEDVYGQQEFGDGINSVTDKQELPAADETGLTAEKNLDQGSQGGTFPNEGQANPVTSKVAEIIGENAGRALYEDAVDQNMTVHDRLMEIYDQLEGMQGGEGLTEQAAADVQQAMALIDNALADTYNAEPTGDHEMMDSPDHPYEHGAGGGDPDEGYW